DLRTSVPEQKEPLTPASQSEYRLDLPRTASPSVLDISSRKRSSSLDIPQRIGEAIKSAADLYNPLNRPISSAGVRPAPTPSERLLSVARAAASASGGRKSRPPSVPIVRKERARRHWALVRDRFCKPQQNRNATLFSLFRFLQPAPYSLTIRHGFRFKFAIRQKHAIVCVVHHARVPIHHLDGRLRIERSRIVEDDDSAGDSSDSEGHAGEKKLSGAAEGGARVTSEYTFVTVDRARNVTVWDVDRASMFKARSKTKIKADLTSICFVSKFSMYAACSHDKSIKFYNSRFESTNVFCTYQPVQFVLYNSLSHELITVGSHDISIWTLEGIIHCLPYRLQNQTLSGNAPISNIMRLEPTMKFTMETGLPKDQWITNVYSDEKNHRIYAIIDKKVLVKYRSVTEGCLHLIRQSDVYDQSRGELLERMNNISNRQLCRTLHYDRYHYTIVACADGTLKVRNMANALVHEFSSHTKPVTALGLYPHGPLIVSAALDYTVRLYCLKTFKEVYCLHLRDLPLNLQMMDDKQLFIQTRNTIEVWSLNHMNSGFAAVNSRVFQLLNIKTPNVPSRILARTEDGVIRILSPVSGKAITTSLPLLETEYVHVIAYGAKIDRMYLMLESGEVWVVATNFNPCLIVDIWRLSGATQEDCSCIVLYDGRFKESDELPPNYDTSKGYAFLFGATRNGQVLIYGRGGVIQDRYQLHNGEITQMACDESQQLLITGGSGMYKGVDLPISSYFDLCAIHTRDSHPAPRNQDETIKISEISPTGEEIIQVRIAITTHFVPRVISVLDTTLCVSSDDWTIHMFNFNVNRKEWQEYPAHMRSDDHTDSVTSICSIRKLGLFVTGSKDGTLRLWDTYNTLLREIQFAEPVESVCAANSHGDILIGIHNRIDIMKYSLYLPPGYSQTVNRLRLVEEPAESPIPFDDDRLQWKAISHRPPRRPRTQAAAPIPCELFFEINLVPTDRIGPVSLRDQRQAEDPKSDDEYAAIMSKLEMLVARRRTIMDSTVKRAAVESARGAPQEHVLHEEFERFMLFRKYRGNSAHGLDDVPVDLRPTSPEPAILSVAEPAEPDEHPEAHIEEPECLNEDTKLPPSAPEPVDPKTTEPPKAHTRAHTDSVPIAPDGQIPNSLLRSSVDAWRLAHASFQIADLAVARHNVKKESIASTVDEEKTRKSKEYKERLHQLLNALPREEEKANDTEGNEEVVEAIAKDGEGSFEDDEGEEMERHRMRLPNQAALRIPHEKLAIVQTIIEVKIPGIVTRAMAYSWFPMDEVFYPEADTVGHKSYLSHPTRKLKIDPLPDNLVPLMLDIFRNSTLNETRLEVTEYLNWIFEEYGIRDSTLLLRCYCRYLQSNLDGRWDNEEIETRVASIETLAHIAPNHAEIVPTLLLYLVSPYEQIRSRAEQFLTALGACMRIPTLSVGDDTTATLLPAEPRTLTPTTSDRTFELRNVATMWVRQSLKKFLVRATSDRDIAKKIKGLTAFGLEGRGKTPKSTGSGSGSHGGGGGLEAGDGHGGFHGSSGPPTPRALSSAASTASKRSDSVLSSDASKGQGHKTALRKGNSKAGTTTTTVPAKGPNTHGRGDEVAKGKPSLVNPEKVASGSKGTSVVRNSRGEGKKKTAGPSKGHAKTSKNVATADLMPVADSESKSSDQLDRDLRSMVKERHHTVEEEVAETDGAPEARAFCATLQIERPMSGRSPITVLQNPSGQDFINAINYFIISIEQRLARQEAERLERVRLASLEAERLRREAEKQDAYLQYRARMEAERAEREIERRRRIGERRLSLQVGPAKLPKLKGMKIAEMRTGGVGRTHKSECHPSRETLDVEFQRFPFLGSGSSQGAHRHATDLSMHIQKLNKSMPVEHVNIRPFGDQPTEDPHPKAQSANIRPFSASRPATTPPLGSTLAPAQLAPTWREFDIQPETRERSSTQENDRAAYRTQRKYFIPDLSQGSEELDTGKTFDVCL
ncbi:hypothetical protein BDK51DRAFT_29905, partial [Blyttiomyces helicus]